ncbi:glutathione peroxidase [Bauldia litoralis]|uniref:glutathione peroxidase n=1 Tax=Bauldia litoralis TaxID=665467 RepID=UPI003263F87B
MNAPLYDIPVKRIDGKETTLAEHAGEVLLIVNVASKCGKTPQYAGLEKLHADYGKRGLAVLGFPCNQFGGQEPGTEAEILDFCRTIYGVDFPMFAKLDVKGPDQHPLYHLLTEAQPTRIVPPGKEHKPGSEVRWNFEKFVVGRDGSVAARFDPDVTPEDDILIQAIEHELAKPA